MFLFVFHKLDHQEFNQRFVRLLQIIILYLTHFQFISNYFQIYSPFSILFKNQIETFMFVCWLVCRLVLSFPKRTGSNTSMLQPIKALVFMVTAICILKSCQQISVYLSCLLVCQLLFSDPGNEILSN